MRRPITQENLRAITDPHSEEATQARWRRTRGRMLRVLLWALFIIGGVKLYTLAREWTSVPLDEGGQLRSDAETGRAAEPLS